AARHAHHRDSCAEAMVPLGGLGSGGEIEIDVGGDEKVQLSVAVVVDKSAAGAPGFAGAGDAGFFADVGKGSVSVVVIEDVFSVVGDVEVFEAGVVVNADANALAPAGVAEAGFLGDVGEGAVVVVVIEA